MRRVSILIDTRILTKIIGIHRAVKSPQILELSGIGKPSVLSDIGIECKIDLPGVGENVQEHTFNLVCYELEPEASYKTWDLLLDPTYATNARALQLSNSVTFTIIKVLNQST